MPSPSRPGNRLPVLALVGALAFAAALTAAITLEPRPGYAQLAVLEDDDDSPSATLEAGDAALRSTFDGGRGTVWLMPHSRGRRVGASFVLEHGAALWSHPDIRATVSTAEVELQVERGALLGLHRPAQGGETTVDHYLGRVTAGRQRLEPGRRVALDAQGTVRDLGTAASPLGTWGAAPFEAPRLADSSAFPRGFVGVVQVALPGQRTPLRLDPRELELDIQPAGLSAEVRARLRFELDPDHGIPCCEPLLGVFEALLPQDALLRGVELELGGQRYIAEPTVIETGGARNTLSAIIEPHDPGTGLIERVPFGLWPLDPRAPTVLVELTWTQPMQLATEGSALHIPAVGSLAATSLGRLEVVIDPAPGSTVLAASHPLQAQDALWRFSASDYTPTSGLALLVGPREHAGEPGTRTWAGRTPGLDGYFFATETPLPRVAPGERGTDYIVVVDHSAGIDALSATHLRDATLALAGGVLDPARDRLLVLRLDRQVLPLTTGLVHVDDRVLAEIREGLTGEGSGAAELSRALTRVVEEARSRDDAAGRSLQVVILGKLRPPGIDTAVLDQRLGELAASDAGLALLDVTSGDNPALAAFLEDWSVATLRAVPSTAGTLSAARVVSLLGFGLEPGPELRFKPGNVNQVNNTWTAVPRQTGASRLVAGVLLSAGPFFDLPGEIELCTVTRGTSECLTDPRTIALSEAQRDTGLGVLHTAHALRTPNASSSAARPLQLLQGSEVFGLPEVRAGFDLEYFERRARGALETHWLRYESALRAPAGGRAAPNLQAPPLPEVSSSAGETLRASSLPLERDPWLQTTPASPLPPPTLAEVLSGQRQGTSVSGGGDGYESDAGGEHSAVSVARAYVENSLVDSRNQVFQTLLSQDTMRAQRFLEAWHELALDSPHQLWALQTHYYSLGLYDHAALTSYDLQVTSHMSDAQRKEVARYFLDRKRWKRAERVLLRGLELAPEDRFYADGLVQVYEATGRKAEVARIEIAALERQLARTPERTALIETTLARLVRAGRSDAARRAIDSWGERSGRSPTWHGLKARLALLDGRHDEALEHLRQGVESFPDARYAHALLVDGLLEAGRTREALEAAETWLRLDPHNAFLLQLVGDLHMRQGKPERSLDTYERLVELVPQSALGYLKRGDALDALAQDDAAAAAYSYALRLEPSSLAANLRVLEATVRTGDFETAVSSFDRIRQMNAMASGLDGARTRDEIYYQLLVQWRAEAVWRGDDALLARINEKLRSFYVDFSVVSYSGTANAYALRVAFVPDTTAPDVIADLRITEPGGYLISALSPYNSALSSQLYMGYGRVGPGPRVYFLPQAVEGAFRIEVSHGGPVDLGPLRGRLFVHKIPRPFTEYWSQYDVVLEHSGESWSTEVVIDAPPQGDRVAPLELR